MISNIENEQNKEKVAIVVVGFNRLCSLTRLLNSLLRASYPSNDIPLIISIDSSDNEELYSYVNNFKWPYGDKYHIIHQKRLGLKQHIYSCGEFVKFFKGIIMLEDDLFVSTYFYYYAIIALKKYCATDEIAGISLYNLEINGYVRLPFQPQCNGYDVYAIQTVTSWGQCWNERMWTSFRIWLEKNEPINFDKIDMPYQIKGWSRAWSKYFYAFLISTNKYFIFPYISLSTNFSDSGEHKNFGSTAFQVNLLTGEKQYNMPGFTELVKYDVYSNPVGLSIFLGVPEKDLCVDFWNNNPNTLNKRYVLSPYWRPFMIIKCFGTKLRPLELNVVYKIDGKGLYLYDTTIPYRNSSFNKYRLNILEYYLHGFDKLDMFTFILKNYKTIIKRIIKSLLKK